MRKTIIIISVMLLSAGFCFSQGTAINTTGSKADNSAILDISSTSQGMLVPRMTSTEKTNIVSPATGLMIFQTDGISGFYYFDGAVWKYTGGDNLGNHTATDSLDMANYKIKNLTTCTANLDAANKAYVDAQVAAGGGIAGGTCPTAMSVNKCPSTCTYNVCRDSCINLGPGWHIPSFEEENCIISGILGTPADGWINAWVWTSTPCWYGLYGTAYMGNFLMTNEYTQSITRTAPTNSYNCRCTK